MSTSAYEYWRSSRLTKSFQERFAFLEDMPAGTHAEVMAFAEFYADHRELALRRAQAMEEAGHKVLDNAGPKE